MSSLNCPDCGAPNEPVRKFNGGDPVIVNYPTCDCEEVKNEARVEGFLKRLEERKNLQGSNQNPENPKGQHND